VARDSLRDLYKDSLTYDYLLRFQAAVVITLPNEEDALTRIISKPPKDRVSDPELWDCVHNVVHTGIGDRTCPIPYLCYTLLACKVELVNIEGSYSSCTRVRFLS
jgi:hypothetical protein